MSIQRLGLWLYGKASRFGLFTSPRAERLFNHAYFAYKRHLEDPFYRLSLQHPEFFTGGHILDIGANVGYTAAVFAAAVDKKFLVWAFEPVTENFRRLESTMRQRRLHHRIRALRCAVGDRLGTVDLRINERHPGDHQVDEDLVGQSQGVRLEHVEITTVDEAVRIHSVAPVVFIKVDVQGYELHVCRGMTKTLEANPEVTVVVEFCPEALRKYNVEPNELPQFFRSRGYTAFELSRDGHLAPADEATLFDSLPPGGYVDLLFTRTPSRASR